MKNLGGKLRPKDERDVMLGKAQQPVSIPGSYQTDITGLIPNYQGETPYCGWHMGSHLLSVLEKDRFTPRYLTIYGKNPKSPVYDGYTIEDGTTMTAVFKVLQKIGADTFEPMENDITLPLPTYCNPASVTPAEDQSAGGHQIENYAFLDSVTFPSICQAVYQNKAVALLVHCDDGWWQSDTPTFTSPTYTHFIVAYGYDAQYLYIIDSADNVHPLKKIDKKYITPTFFLEGGTVIDKISYEKAVADIQEAQTAVNAIQSSNEPVSVKLTLLSLVQKVAQMIQQLFK